MLNDYYREATRKAILEPVMNEIYEMKLVYKDGKLTQGPLVTIDADSLWVWTGLEKTRKCVTWNGLYFTKYGFISRNCFSCWKIFCKLDFIIDLLKVKELQKMMFEESLGKVVGKCGPEFRPYASYGGKYLAVWYPPLTKTNTLKDAKDLAVSVKDALEKIEIKNKVYLVRGCTEMEMKAGPSSDWVYPEEMHEFEDRLDDLFDIKQMTDILSEHSEYKIKKWVEIAFRSGDPTVKYLVNSFPEDFGVRPRVNYMEEQPKIASNWVKRGKLYDTDARESSSREEHEGILIL